MGFLPAIDIKSNLIHPTFAGDVSVKEDQVRPKKGPPGRNKKAQKQFILDHPFNYSVIMFNNIFSPLLLFYVKSFIGKPGWLRLSLPDWLVVLYLVTLCIVVLFNFSTEIRMKKRHKMLIGGLFVLGVVLVLTGLYVGWTAVGKNYIGGVQGRYFIPFSPLLFLLFYNNKVSQWLTGSLSNENKKLAMQLFHLFLIAVPIAALTTTVLVILQGFWVIPF